jgi:hypothetical protein
VLLFEHPELFFLFFVSSCFDHAVVVVFVVAVAMVVVMEGWNGVTEW